MLQLTVPTPTVDPPSPALLEAPLNLRCVGVAFSDGTSFDASRLGRACFFTYRQQAAAGPVEVWDGTAKVWRLDPGAAVVGMPAPSLAFTGGAWTGVVVAAGQKDANQVDQFAVAAPFPLYFFRTYFEATDQGTRIAALSGPSTPVGFRHALDAMRAGLTPGTGETPMNASRVRLFVRDAGLQERGHIEIRNDTPAAEIEIVNLTPAGSWAVVRLLPSGDISLTPAPGRKVVVDGPLEVGLFTYAPALGGPKVTL